MSIKILLFAILALMGVGLTWIMTWQTTWFFRDSLPSTLGVMALVVFVASTALRTSRRR